MWLRRFLFTFMAVLAPATLLSAALPKDDALPENASLAGQLLIAAPEIQDPHFYRTVIVIARHTKDGAFGIVINRPIGEPTLASLLETLGEMERADEGSIPIFAGGPVEPQVGFVVHSLDYHRAETIEIGSNLALTSSREILRDMSHHKGPKKALVAFGYAGWGPGQLEREMLHHDWFTAAADPKLIFEEPREKVWDNAMERRTRDL
jgi:putative transcriptional regulator